MALILVTATRGDFAADDRSVGLGPEHGMRLHGEELALEVGKASRRLFDGDGACGLSSRTPPGHRAPAGRDITTDKQAIGWWRGRHSLPALYVCGDEVPGAHWSEFVDPGSKPLSAVLTPGRRR